MSFSVQRVYFAFVVDRRFDVCGCVCVDFLFLYVLFFVDVCVCVCECLCCDTYYGGMS